MAIQNHQHQYGCALYVRQTTHTTYVRKQDHIHHMGDMLDSTMRKANVIPWRNTCAHVQDDAKNVWPWMEGKKHLDDILHIKFSHIDIKQCEGEK
jgi:hypothetical protein